MPLPYFGMQSQGPRMRGKKKEAEKRRATIPDVFLSRLCLAIKHNRFLDLMVPSTERPYKELLHKTVHPDWLYLIVKVLSSRVLILSLCLSCKGVDTEHVFRVSFHCVQQKVNDVVSAEGKVRFRVWG